LPGGPAPGVLPPLYREFRDMPVISISNSQRKPLPFAHWVGTVYHGLPHASFVFNPRPDSYLVFLGRISPEKQVDRAIEIAKRAGRKLKIAAKIDPVDRHYFNKYIKHLLDEPFVEFIGEINQPEKDKLLGGASALLFPIDWPEPFGLVMIEALACGTPVIAFRRGSVSEVIVEGETGFIVDDIEGAVEAVNKIGRIDRVRCRAEFEKRFTDRRMAEDYLKLYRRLLVPSSQRQAA